MKFIYSMILFLMLSGVTAAKEQILFNGKDLTGWDGKPGWWSVEDGAITSESTPEKKCHKANYLIWTGGEPADFELSLDFKLSPNANKSNSGVQIRSERRPDWDTFGYQADMTATGHLSGFVYHHSRGLIAARGEKVKITPEGERVVQKLSGAEQINAAFKVGEWNHYRIVCEGPDITLYLNGVRVCEFSDHHPKLARSKGIIALQMHPGPPMKVQFKNIILKPLNAGTEEAALIAVLTSDSGFEAKREACLQLAQVGSADAVPVLAALLADEKLSHMARFALLSIPDPSVDEVLREALKELKGELLAGVICTIGHRRDAAAVNALLSLLESKDAIVAQASAVALGQLGTAEAVGGLQAALSNVKGRTRPAIYEALLRHGESLEEKGALEAASVHYESLLNLPHIPEQFRAAAFRGAVITGGKEGLSLLAESLRSGDEVLFQAGLAVALELKGPAVAEWMVDAMQGASVERRILLLGTMGPLGERSVLPVLLELAKGGDVSVRLAALRAASEIGGSEVIAPFMELMKDPSPGIAQVASAGLAGLRSAELDAVVVRSLSEADPRIQVKLAELAAQRRIEAALPALEVLLDSPNPELRVAAIKSYGELAGIAELPVLLAAIQKRTDPADIAALGKAIVLVCVRAEAPDAYLPQIKAAEAVAIPEAKPMLRKVLKRMGGSAASK